MATSLTVWTVHSICTYMIFIYIDISLSIYRSIFLYLFWLADIFASVERPDNKSLHLADMILIKLSNLLLGARQHHTTSGVSPTMRCGRLPSRSDVNNPTFHRKTSNLLKTQCHKPIFTQPTFPLAIKNHNP